MEDRVPFGDILGDEAIPERRPRMEIEPLDLGADVRAVGFELIDPETREPVIAAEAAVIWAATLRALAGSEPWTLDFFAHLERVREFCRLRGIAFREPNSHVLVIDAPALEHLDALLERFASETFGVRSGGTAISGDATLESGLAERGVDAYHAAFTRYLFCGVCDFENGFFTLLSERLWASEVIRRVRPAVADFRVDVVRPA
jgi:hypothetical protein